MKADQFAIIVSQFNKIITDKLLEGAKRRCKERNIQEKQLTIVSVPGAIEIPLTAQFLAKTQRYSSIICLGSVIRGETSHYDYVCQQVSYGCQRVSLDHHLPIIFGVLTTENLEQALDRVGGAHGHKGEEAIDTAIAMIKLLKEHPLDKKSIYQGNKINVS